MKGLKMLAAALLGLTCALAVPKYAHAVADAPVLPGANGQTGPALAQSLAFIGASACRVESSTPTLVAVSCATGKSGLLYALFVTSGTTGDTAIGMDSTQAALPAATTGGYDTVGKKITPLVFSVTSVSNCTSASACGQYIPPGGPIRFENGLGLMRNGTANVLAIYRLDSGSNPGP